MQLSSTDSSGRKKPEPILNSEFEHIDSIILPTDFQKSVGEFSLNNNMDEIVYFNADKALGEYKVSIFKLTQN